MILPGSMGGGESLWELTRPAVYCGDDSGLRNGRCPRHGFHPEPSEKSLRNTEHPPSKRDTESRDGKRINTGSLESARVAPQRTSPPAGVASSPKKAALVLQFLFRRSPTRVPCVVIRQSSFCSKALSRGSASQIQLRLGLSLVPGSASRFCLHALSPSHQSLSFSFRAAVNELLACASESTRGLDGEPSAGRHSTMREKTCTMQCAMYSILFVHGPQRQDSL